MKSGKIMINGSSLDNVTLSGVTPCDYDEATLNISFCCMEMNTNTEDIFQEPHPSASVFLPSSGPFYLLKVSSKHDYSLIKGSRSMIVEYFTYNQPLNCFKSSNSPLHICVLRFDFV